MGEEWLGKDRYIVAVQNESARLAQAAREGLQVPVPSCPGWSLAYLVAHIGEVQRFWAHQVASRAQEAVELPRAEFESCPGLYEWYGEDTPDPARAPSGLIEWFEGGTQQLLDAFRGIDPEETVWHWSGDNRAITHMRNQAMEATVHRWDAENAHHAATPIPEDIAADGIEQHFEVQIAAARTWAQEPRLGTGETFHFHRTDGPGEWLVRFDGDEAVVTREHGKGDVAVRGPVEDLFLWLWGRIPADRLDIHGDGSLLEHYRQLVPQ